ncbi:MAG: hypothetical protein JW896_18440 [Deltaproteobacteria bacterium]|nr:hypothetical protein [Deltaproteobacteria bacterium]
MLQLPEKLRNVLEAMVEEKRLVNLKNEAIEILSMVVASIKTARYRK